MKTSKLRTLKRWASESNDMQLIYIENSDNCLSDNTEVSCYVTGRCGNVLSMISRVVVRILLDNNISLEDFLVGFFKVYSRIILKEYFPSIKDKESDN